MMNAMKQKRIQNHDRIELIAGMPVVGERCMLRLWDGCRYVDILTSPVESWWEGYPHAVGGIRIETRNTVYRGAYNRR